MRDTDLCGEWVGRSNAPSGHMPSKVQHVRNVGLELRVSKLLDHSPAVGRRVKVRAITHTGRDGDLNGGRCNNSINAGGDTGRIGG